MKAFLFIAVVLVLMAMLGWIQFHRSSDQAAVTVETKIIEKDLRKTADVVREKTTETLNDLQAPAHPSPAAPRAD